MLINIKLWIDFNIFIWTQSTLDVIYFPEHESMSFCLQFCKTIRVRWGQEGVSYIKPRLEHSKGKSSRVN